MPSHRLLDSDEADLLLDLSVSAESAWDVAVVTADDTFAQAVNKAFETDREVQIQHLSTGGDMLIQSTRIKPDVLVLDERIDDIAAVIVAKSLRRHEEFGDMKILATGAADTAPSAFRGLIDDWYDTADSDRILLVRKIRWLLDTPMESTPPGQTYHRRWPRTRVNIAAAVELFTDQNPTSVLSGNAVVKDISRNGAFLTDMALDGDMKPDIRYRARLHINHPPLEGIETDSMVVRITSKDTAGIRFVNMPKSDRHRITDLCDE